MSLREDGLVAENGLKIKVFKLNWHLINPKSHNQSWKVALTSKICLFNDTEATFKKKKSKQIINIIPHLVLQPFAAFNIVLTIFYFRFHHDSILLLLAQKNWKCVFRDEFKANTLSELSINAGFVDDGGLRQDA